MKGNVGKLLASVPVDFVREAGMVGIQFGAVGQNLIGKAVKFGNVNRKPGNVVVVVARREDAHVGHVLVRIQHHDSLLD